MQTAVEVSLENLVSGIKFSWPIYKSGFKVLIASAVQMGGEPWTQRAACQHSGLDAISCTCSWVVAVRIKHILMPLVHAWRGLHTLSPSTHWRISFVGQRWQLILRMKTAQPVPSHSFCTQVIVPSVTKAHGLQRVTWHGWT